ncbi:MAG: hypothetical protein CL676_11895 [Bdellovibrionaceae bacterium]|nr:hypothetical protein [Pseudobdellovibrionaceae bacterium]
MDRNLKNDLCQKFAIVGSVLILFAGTWAQALEVKPYGRLKFSSITATQKVMSFSKETHSAITHAGQTASTPEAQKKYDESARSTFQTQQSRLGLNVSEGDNLKGKVEIDFVDFNQSTHGAGNQFRIRQGYIEYGFGDFTLTGGQKWITFSGVVPHTYNIVQASFYSGNSGFIGQELSLKWNASEAFTLYGALGARGKNTTATQTKQELGYLPALTLRGDVHLGMGLVGFAAIYGKMNNEDLDTNTSSTFEDSTSYAYKVFTDLKFSVLNLKSEIFYGENTEDLALLALAGSNYSNANKRSVQTYGGFLSLSTALGEKSSVWAGYGMAQHNKASEVIAANGLSRNELIRLGADYAAKENFKFFLELTHFQTQYVATTDADEKATVAELGMNLTF